MPLLRRQPFVKQKPPPDLRPDEEVFFCPLTNEIFRDYEQFFERIILCNSLVWTCSITGRPGLTYQEALDCEERAKKQLASFPDNLQKPILFLSTLTHRSRVNELNDDVFVFARDRYFIGEAVEVLMGTEKRPCKILKVIPPPKQNGTAVNGAKDSDDSDCICLDDDDDEPLVKVKETTASPKSPMKDFEKTKAMGADPTTYQYVVQEMKKSAGHSITVKAGKINRKKGLLTRDKCKLYLKQHCDSSGDGIWRVKAKYVKKFKLTEATLEDFFSGPLPNFIKTKSKKFGKGNDKKANLIDLTGEDEFIRQKKKERKEKKQALKQQKKEMKQILEEPRLTADEIAQLKSRWKSDKEAKKEELKKQWEEEKQKRKEERDKERRERHEIERQLHEEFRIQKELIRQAMLEEARKMKHEEKIKAKQDRLERMMQDKENRLAEKLRVKEQMERERQERNKARQYEKQRMKAEKREKLFQEREKKREEKKQREEYIKSWSKPRDDLECDDLKDLPVATPVETGIPCEDFGDVVLIIEFLQGFIALFDVEEELGNGLTLDRLVKALQDSELNNLYFDLLKFLLVAILNLQGEEEEEEQELQDKADAYTDLKGFNAQNASHQELVKQATIAAQWPQLNYGTTLKQLDIDPFTVTEILRLHFMGSGSEGSASSAKFRWQQRGGYVSSDDAGLEFRRQEPEILQALTNGNVFDLSPGNKLKILNALINQLLTYVACRDFVEDNYEKLRQARYDLKQHQWVEQRREKDEAAFWYKKRVEERRKEAEAEAERKAQKKKEREERLKIDEFRKTAHEKGKSIRDYLKDEGYTELVQRYDADQKEKEKENKEKEAEKNPSPRQLRSKDPKPEVEPGRKSARQKQAKEKSIHVDDIPVENVEWDKVTPDERVMWKKLHEDKEQELMELMTELQHGYAIFPIGRDRTFRRYWVFNSLAGLFVEDDEGYIPDDFLQPVKQTGAASNPFSGENLPLPNGGSVVSKEDKSTSSDKENDGSPEKNLSVPSTDTSGIKPKILAENNYGVGADAVPMEVDDISQDIQTISVHDQIAQRNVNKWSYYNTPEQFDKLISSLNPRGFREGPLKHALLENKVRILKNMSECCTDVLSISKEQQRESSEKKLKLQPVKSQSRKKIMHGVVQGSSAKELMELNLRQMILDLEERLRMASIGILKVNDRVKWRDALENGSYDPQSDEFLSSIPTPQKTETNVKKEDSDDDDEDTGPQVVQDLSRALTQISRCIEPKYICSPLRENNNTKDGKQKTTSKKEKSDVNDNSSDSDDEVENGITKKTALERWQDSLLSSTNLSQVFLHLTVLDSCVVWSKSFLNAHCRLCRRKKDAEKMLLCDGCDRGHHMYCLKPPMKKVPEGDWFCNECKPKDIMKTPRKARRQSSTRERDEINESEDEEDDEEEDTDSEENTSDEGSNDSEEDEADTSSEDDDDSSDASSDDSSDGDKEEDTGPAKIKLGTRRSINFGKKNKSAPSSGRSTPTSMKSGRGSKPSTPREGTPEVSGTRSKRASLNTSLETSNSRKSGGRRGNENANSRRSTEATSRRSVEKVKGRQSLEKGSNRRSAGGKRGRTSDSSTDEDDGPVAKKGATKVRGGEDAENVAKCENLLGELMKHQDAWPFLRPVSRRDAPDYFEIISTPMDFSTIRCKLNKFEYQDAADILEDLRLVFANCEQYNVITAEEYKAGQRLCRLFVNRVKELRLDLVLARKSFTKSDDTNSGNTRSRRK